MHVCEHGRRQHVGGVQDGDLPVRHAVERLQAVEPRRAGERHDRHRPPVPLQHRRPVRARRPGHVRRGVGGMRVDRHHHRAGANRDGLVVRRPGPALPPGDPGGGVLQAEPEPLQFGDQVGLRNQGRAVEDGELHGADPSRGQGDGWRRRRPAGGQVVDDVGGVPGDAAEPARPPSVQPRQAEEIQPAARASRPGRGRGSRGRRRPAPAPTGSPTGSRPPRRPT